MNLSCTVISDLHGVLAYKIHMKYMQCFSISKSSSWIISLPPSNRLLRLFYHHPRMTSFLDDSIPSPLPFSSCTPSISQGPSPDELFCSALLNLLASHVFHPHQKIHGR